MLDSIEANGFSCPSTVFVSSAVYSSGKPMGTAFAPSALNISMKMGIWMTRIFNPWMSSSFATGLLLLVRLRKP